jgi:hypothetical protein
MTYYDDGWAEYEHFTERIKYYEEAIRKHRDQRGDDRCWMDDEELYKTLPEGYTPPQRDTCVRLELCKKYIECRQNPKTEYISPQRRIEELEKEVETLRTEKLEVMNYSRKLMKVIQNVISSIGKGVEEAYNEIR